MIQQALNDQMNRERFNHATYRAMSDALAFVNWDGSSKYMDRQAADEQEHARKFASYMIDRNWTVTHDTLSAPVIPSGDDLTAYFVAAIQLENATTEAINTLYFQAEAEEDPQTCQFLLWFLEEQTKSFRELNDIIKELSRVDRTGWLILDEKYKG